MRSMAMKLLMVAVFVQQVWAGTSSGVVTAGYSSSSSVAYAPPMLYLLKSDGSVVRQPLLGGAGITLIPARATASKTLALGTYGRVQVFAEDQSGLVRARPLNVGALLDTIKPIMSAVQAMSMGMYDLYELVSYGSITRIVHRPFPAASTDTMATLTGYSPIAMEYRVDVNNMIYALVRNTATLGVSIKSYLQGGSLQASLLQSTDTLRNLRGLALDHTGDTLWSFDQGLGQFVKISISGNSVTSVPILTDSVYAMRIAADSSLWWSNAQGLWHAAKNGSAFQVTQVVTGVSIPAFAIDDQNMRPTFVAKRVFPTRSVPIGGGLPFNFIGYTAWDSDSMTCQIFPYGTLKGVLFNQESQGSPCNNYFLQNSGSPAAGSMDSALFVLSDLRGGVDSMTVVWSYNVESKPVITMPDTVHALADNDSYTSLQVSYVSGATQTTVLMHDVDSIRNLAVDTICPTVTTAWFMQSFLTGAVGGSLSEITAGLKFAGPVKVSLINGYLWTPGSTYEIWSQVYMPNPSTLVQMWPITNGFSLAANTMYSLVFEPLGTQTGQVCYEATGTYSNGNMASAENPTNIQRDLYFKVMEEDNYSIQWARLLGSGSDSLKIGTVAPKTYAGQTIPFHLIADDGVNAVSRAFNISVKNASLPAFVAPAMVRVARRNLSSDPSPYVYGWLNTELSWDPPRTYNVQILDSAMWQSTPIVDNMGGLTAYIAVGAIGQARFLIQRCQTDTSACSNWDTASVYISIPPTINVTLPDSVEAGTTQTVPVILSNPNLSDTAYTSVMWQGVNYVARTSGGAAYGTCAVCVQTFQAKTSGMIHSVRVDAAFSADTVQLMFKKVSDISAFDFSGSPTVQSVMVKTQGSTLQWQTLELGASVQLDSGAYYALSLGNPYTQTTDSIYWSLGPDSIVGSTYQYQYASAQTDHLDGTKDFAFELPLDSMAPMFISLQHIAGYSYSMQISPPMSAAGNYPLVIRANDGSIGFSEVYTSLKVTPSTLVPSITHQALLRFATIPEATWRTKANWLSTSALASLTPTYETEFATALDSTFFQGNLPVVSGMGGLTVYQPAQATGSGRFLLRACYAKCSAWDTVTLRIMSVPSLTLPALDSIHANTDTTLNLTVSDPNFATMDSVVLQQSWLNQSFVRPNQNSTVQATTVTQAIVFGSDVNPGELRVFAKFPRNYVHVVIQNAARTTGAVAANSSSPLIDFFAPVTPNVLQWNEIPIPPVVLMNAATTWNLVLGSANSQDTIVWGVDTTAANIGSVFGSGAMAGASNVPSLVFELWGRSQSPVWSSATIANGVAQWRVRPASSDTGLVTLLFTANDGVAATSVIRKLRILPGLNKQDSAKKDSSQNHPSLTYNMDGPAVQFVCYACQKNLSISKVLLKISGSGIDTSFTMQGDTALWAPAPYGTYLFTWTMLGADSATVLQSGHDSLTVASSLFTPPATQTWYMAGFGCVPMAFSTFKSLTQVFGWNDTLSTTSQDRYVSRDDLLTSQPGRGYWYYTESPDTLPMPVLTSLPAPWVDTLVNGGTGWNMISNPWPWSIALDSSRTFWTWNSSTSAYQMVTFINGYMAAWVNTAADTTLTLQPKPVFHAGQNQNLQRKNAALYASVQDWTVQAKLVANAQSDAWNFLGVTTKALSANDLAANAKPPIGFGDPVGLSFVRNGKILARDLVSPQDSARWTMNLSAQRDRTASLEFTGTASLRGAGLKLALITADGSAQEITEGVPVRVSLHKGTVQAVVQAVPANEVLSAGALQNLRVVRAGLTAQISFEASLGLAGHNAEVEWVDVNGQLLEHTHMTLTAGLNTFALQTAPHAGISFLRLRSLSQVATTTVVMP